MARITFSISLAVLLVVGLVIWLSPNSIQAAEQIGRGLDVQMNSEGDEWMVVDPQKAAPTPLTPDVTTQNESEALPLVQPVPVVPGPEVALGLALDQARQAGPEAVLAFVANQSNPGLPLLEAAVVDARNELDAWRTPAIERPNVANWVAVNNGPCVYSSIQTAINAAPSGATLLTASGSYIENFDVAGGKILTIVGGYDANCTSPIPGAITEIHAGVAGSVVDLTQGSNLTMRNLDLSGGTGSGAGVDLLGNSKVTLDNTDVHDNGGVLGGGLYIGGGSILTYTNDVDIYDNTASAGGAAIVYGSLFGYMTNSDIYGNSSTNDGGGLYIVEGTVVLDNSDVVANTASGEGGGVYLVNGILKLSNSVFVGETAPCCQSAAYGGGIYASGSQIFLTNGSNVMNNTAINYGGGLYLVNGSQLIVTNSQVGNTVYATGGNDAVLGAGMYVDSSQVTFNGKIVNNIATNSGAGIYATNSTITMTQSTVGGLNINEPNRIGPTGLNGGGLYLINNTHALLNQTDIFSNTLTNTGTGYGGGIYIRDGSILTMTNSRVEEHKLPSAFDGRGAGLYIYNATVTMSNTVVANNTAANIGGGVRMFDTSTLNILDGSLFSNNQASGGNGGGIAATNNPVIKVADSIFQQNHASGSGGAVYLDAGTLSFDGAWGVSANDANGNGGGLAVVGSGDARFSAAKGPGIILISDNHSGGHGGALYLENDTYLELYATKGYTLAIQRNTAGLDGGAAYANGGGLFDLYGDVSVNNNSALGNGGGFYLSGGSRIWMDDYFTTQPSLDGNEAANGGAIYALNSPRVECDGALFGSSGSGNIATAGSGGALYLNNSTFSADNCVFKGNQAMAGNGGAIAALASTLNVNASYVLSPAEDAQQSTIMVRNVANAPLASGCDPVTQDCSRMTLNTASGDGGALYATNSNVTVEKTIFDQNTANHGGAIYLEGAGAVSEISNVLVAKNTSFQPVGAGIRATNGGTITIRHATLAHNTGGAGFSLGSSVANVYNTIIWGNADASFTPLAIAECNIDQGGTAGLAVNPQFLSPTAGVFRPTHSSPAIDACTTGLTTDLLGTTRPIGPLFDMGAYEGLLPMVFMPMVVR